MCTPLYIIGVFLPGLLLGEIRENNGVFTMQQNQDNAQHNGYDSLDSYPFRNTSLSWKDRVDDLVSRLTLNELNDQVFKKMIRERFT